MPAFTEPGLPALGDLLRWWRRRRGLSQMKLALEAGISPRHMSFIETGRARPGREVLIRVARALDLPFRETNVLLESAGHAREFRESRVGELEFERLRSILEVILARYEPYGAVVVDAEWCLLMANRAHWRLAARLLEETSSRPPEAPTNLLVELFRPGGFRERLVNWPDVAHHMLERLRRQVAENPMREGMRALLDRLETMDLPPRPELRPSVLPVVPLHFVLEGVDVRLVNLITTFGAPQDVAAQELRLEAFLPADAETDLLLRNLAAEERS